MSALVRRSVPGCLERTSGSRTARRRTLPSLATARCNASWMNSLSVEPRNAARALTRRNKGSGKSIVVLIKAYLHKSAGGSTACRPYIRLYPWVGMLQDGAGLRLAMAAHGLADDGV